MKYKAKQTRRNVKKHGGTISPNLHSLIHKYTATRISSFDLFLPPLSSALSKAVCVSPSIQFFKHQCCIMSAEGGNDVGASRFNGLILDSLPAKMEISNDYVVSL